MKHKFIIVVQFLLIIIAAMCVGISIKAASTDSVTATVTAINVSVSVSDGGVLYGTMALNTTADTTSGDLNDTQTATNDGNVEEDFNIMGVDSAAWELGDTNGADQYRHQFSLDGGTGWTPFNEDGYTTLTTNIATSGNDTFDLQIQTPTSTSSYLEQTVDVTVQAIDST